MHDWNDTSTWAILLVDDETDNLEVVAETLQFYGAKVKTAGSGAAALEVLKTFTPTLIVTDLSMPGIDGWQLRVKIRGLPETHDVPIIALSAHAMIGDKERALNAGFDGYLTKPIDVRTLIPDLQTALKRHEMRNALPEGASVTTAEIKAVMGDIKAEVAARITQTATQTAPIVTVAIPAESSEGSLRATQEAKVETAVAVEQTGTVTNEEQVKHEQG